jgi:hypothetical protein
MRNSRALATLLVVTTEYLNATGRPMALETAEMSGAPLKVREPIVHHAN